MDKDAPAPPGDPLAGLVDIPLPPAISLWPQTWPARIALAALIVWLAATIWWLVRHRLANRYRRAALAELDGIVQGSLPGREAWTTAALALLMRRTALAAFPRTEVAALSGADWLSFLDRTYDGHGFTQGVGRALADGLYAPPVIPSALSSRAKRGISRGRSTVTQSQEIPRFARDDGTPGMTDLPHANAQPRTGTARPGLLATLRATLNIPRHDGDLVSLVRCWIRVHHA